MNTCCICNQPSPTVTRRMSRKFNGIDCDKELNSAFFLPAEPTDVFVYSMHAGACELRFAHLADWHAKFHPECQDCIDTKGLEEVSALSAEARGLILHKLRQPLAVISGNAQLAEMEDSNLPVSDYVHRILGAARNLNNEINKLFGTPSEEKETRS